MQLIGEIGTQVSDIVRTEGQLKADKEAREELEARGIKAPGEGASEKDRKAYQDKLVATDAYQRIMGKYGTSGDYQKVTQAVTAALQGLAGGNIGGALAGASAPYLAGVIKKVAGDNENVRVMAHAVLGAVVAQAQGNSAVAGAAGTATGELIAARIYPDKPRDQLSEEEKQTISALATLASALAGAAAGGGLGDAVAAGQAGRNSAENNALSDVAEALAAGKTPEVVAEERVKAENERYKQQNCAGLSSEACSVKMYDERRKNLQEIVATGADYVPVIGDIKSFAEAESALDYLAAAIGVFPGVGDAAGKVLKAAETALKKGDLAEASRLINESSQYIASGSRAADSASNVALFERQRAGYAAQEIKEAQPVGSALKDDPLHRAPSYVVDQIPEKGRLFTIRGGDGKSYNLTQMEGVVDGKSGIFEWLVNSKGELTHQRFIPAGRITGSPNQVPSRLPK